MPETNAQLSTAKPFRVAAFDVEPSALRIGIDGRTVRLEPKTMQVLVYLAENAGRVISRAELEENLWQGRVVTEDALTASISKLRRAFEDNAREPRIIETLPKTGYRLIADVRWSDDGPVGSLAQGTAGSSKAQRLSPRAGLLLLLAGLVGITTWLMARQCSHELIEVSLPTGVLEGKPSVAILPFENLGKDLEQDYFANGITMSVITAMSRVSGLLVIAPGSVFTYRESDTGTRQISRELNADYVIRGSVQRQAGRVRVNVQLIDGTSERALWAKRFDKEWDDVFRLQDHIVAELVKALRIELTPGERDALTQRPTTDIQAYDLFLKGLEEYGRRSPEGNRAARDYFQQVIELDPGFARAVAGLALVYSREAVDGWSADPSRSLERAADLASTAKKINPAIPQVHFVAGQVALFHHEHAAAIEAAKEAIRLSPNYADAYALLAWILNYAGEPEEALEVLGTAVRLNPVMPASYSEMLGEIRFQQGNYAEAMAAFNRALQINPSHMRARMWLIAVLVHTNALEEAQWQTEELLQWIPNFSLQRLRYAFPFRDRSMEKKLLESLHQAGLPE